MPKTPSIIDAIQVTAKLPSTDAKWLYEQGKAGGGAAFVMRQLVANARGMFGLPDPMRKLLEEEAAGLGKSFTQYIVHILALRYEELLSRRLQEEKSQKKR